MIKAIMQHNAWRNTKQTNWSAKHAGATPLHSLMQAALAEDGAAVPEWIILTAIVATFLLLMAVFFSDQGFEALLLIYGEHITFVIESLRQGW